MINKLRENVKNAMLSKDEVTKNALKNVINKATMEAKDAKTEITDEIVLSAISKEIKQLNQTMEELKKGGKTDSVLYVTSDAQKTYLETYLPKQMAAEEIREAVKVLIHMVNTVDRGALMKHIMGALKGKADNKLVSQIAKEEIDNLLK